MESINLRNANLAQFFTPAYAKRYSALISLVQLFEDNSIRWGLACSLLLFFNGIIDDAHDIDIIVHPDDIAKAFKCLNNVGAKHLQRNEDVQRTFFCSKAFEPYEIKGVGLDVISEFGVKSGFADWYKYHFSEDELEWFSIVGYKVPLIPIEAQFCLYSMMTKWQPQRQFKADLIECYLKAGNIRHPKVLEESLSCHLPQELANKVRSLL